MSIRLIVGLGNPGRDYADTRHNLGFLVVDAFAAAHGATWSTRREFRAEVAHLRERNLHLLKPLTFVNASGEAVGPFCRYHRIDPAEVVVVYDEYALPFGRTKLTISGSAGGHNGVASLLQHVGDGFRRLRIGIAPTAPSAIDLKDYVLGKLTPDQRNLFSQNLPGYLDGLELLLTRDVTDAMNQLNRRPPSDSDDDRKQA